MSRLGARLAAVTLVVGLLGGLLGAWGVQRSTRSAVRSQAEQLTVGVAHRLAREIDETIAGLAASLRVLATREQISTLSATSEIELAVALRAFDNVDELVARDADGELVAAVARNRLVDRSGVASGEIPAASAHRAELIAGNHASIGITVAIEDPPGTVVGSLAGQVRLESVVQGLEARLLGPSAKAIFVTADGLIVDHPERNLVLDQETYPIGSISDPERAGTFQRQGARVLAAMAPTSEVPGSVVIEWNEDEALAAAKRDVAFTGILVASIVPVALVIFLVITTRLLHPLDRLRQTLQLLGAGDLSARADEVGSAEFREVAGEINAMASALADQVAELEQAQSELTSANARFRAAFDQAPVPMAIGSSTARIIDANPAFCDLLGRTREEVQGSPVIDMTHPDNRAALGSALLAALESGSPGFQLEELLIRSDGQAVPTFTSVACVRDSHGFLDYFIAHMVDLSELREAEDRFQHIVDSSPDVSIVVDRAGVVEMASRRLSEMFGYEPDDVIGQPVEILVPERLRAVHQLHRMSFTIDTVREMGSGLDLRGRRSDGSEFPVEVALGPIVVGGERKVLARVRDVTERRQGEAASKQLADMHAHQRQAIEINDNVMQGLTVARWSFDLGHVEAARDAVERTVETARLLVDRMLSSSGDIEPGTLRREQPTHSDS